MYYPKWKNYYFETKDKPITSKWLFLRELAKDKLTPTAQLKLEWVIFYHTVAKLKVTTTAKHFGISRKTFHKWLSRFDDSNLLSLEEHSRAPLRTRKRQIDFLTRVRIRNLRKAHLLYGKMKLKRLYFKEYGEEVSSWKIQKVIEGDNLYPDKAKISKGRLKSLQQQALKKKRITQLARQNKVNFLWHVDTVVLTLTEGGYRYLLTATDEVSKVAYARLYTTHSSKQAKDFLLRLNYLTDKRIINLHHDNGSEFKKDFEGACRELNLPQWYSRPRTPKDNPVLERFNRTIQEEFVNFWEVDPSDIEEFNIKLLDWLTEYNALRPHQALAYLTPLEYIDTHQDQQVLPMWSSHTSP